MSFLNSIALWGLLMISIPIILHFWNGKKGKTIAWAAMDFLQISENRVSKGIKLENVLILLLRIVMIILLVMILAKAFWNSTSEETDSKIAHVVNGDKALWEEFRFEIEQALEREEYVFLASDPPQLVESIDVLFQQESSSFLNLQATLDQLPVDLDSLIIYLPNSNLHDDFFLTSINPNFKISTQASVYNPSLVRTTENKILKANEQGILQSQKVSSTESIDLDFSESPIYVTYSVDEIEKETVYAALASISEVYGFSFKETESQDSAQLVFSNQVMDFSDHEKLYFVSGVSEYSDKSNQLIFADNFTFESSELVRQGRLPELILEGFMDFKGLERKSSPMDKEFLEQQFLVHEDSKMQKGKASELWWILLLCTLISERYLALKKGI